MAIIGMTKTFFITGTDTNIGKTTSIVALTKYYQNHNKSVLSLKPIATGCHLENNVLYNSDALALQLASNLDTEYNEINPFRFLPPVSPHLVNNDPGNLVTVEHLVQHCSDMIAKYQPDYCLIEGAGGWLCPLNNTEYLSDLVLKLDIPVILVVGIKLGCLNHAMLTVRAIQNQKVKIHGWIANCLESSQDFDSASNIEYLKTHITDSLLGIIDYDSDSSEFLCL